MQVRPPCIKYNRCTKILLELLRSLSFTSLLLYTWRSRSREGASNAHTAGYSKTLRTRRMQLFAHPSQKITENVKNSTLKHSRTEFSLFSGVLYMQSKVQKSRPRFTPVTLKVTGPARWICLSKCLILSIISIFDLEMTFKVTSGRTGSRIFRLAMVDIPIQCLTSITLRRQIRALPSREGPV